jgi:hypothetical protein
LAPRKRSEAHRPGVSTLDLAAIEGQLRMVENGVEDPVQAPGGTAAESPVGESVPVKATVLSKIQKWGS